MTPVWEDVNARARGLSTHLLSDDRLVTLGESADLVTLADAMRAAGIDVPEGSADAAVLELAARRDATLYVDLLVRWCGPRAGTLAIVLEDEDRRSLRTILRGAAEGVTPEQRVAGLLPTPSLPEAALAELAHQPTVAALAALLIAWRHPYGPPLMPEAGGPHPDLPVLERALNRTFAARALRAARRAGRRGPLLEQVCLTIDLENVQSALALADGDRSVTPKDLFLPGGRRVTIDDFERAIVLGSAGAAARHLAALFGGTPIQAVLRDGAAATGSLDMRLLRARLAMLAAARRLDPLGPLTVIAFMLRLGLQLVELRGIIWRVALQQSPEPRRLASHA